MDGRRRLAVADARAVGKGAEQNLAILKTVTESTLEIAQLRAQVRVSYCFGAAGGGVAGVAAPLA